MTTTLYRVERLGSEDLGPPVSLYKALRQVRRRAPRERENALRILRVDYNLDPDHPPGDVWTPAQSKVWTATVIAFPDIGTMGTFACKTASQHRYGNASDWAAPPDANVHTYLGRVFEWQLREARADRLPLAELIFERTIATAAHTWTKRVYGGIPHVVHVHDSASPLVNTTLPCGDVR
jgi:hypothetical protein